MAGSPAGFDSSLGGIRGVLRHDDGEPIAFASIIVMGTRRGTLSEENGHFTLTRVPVGLQSVRIQFLGLAPFSDTVFVLAGGVREFDVNFDSESWTKHIPRGQLTEMRIHADCASARRAWIRKKGAVHRASISNDSGFHSLGVDTEKPREFIAHYQMRARTIPLTIEVLDSQGTVIRHLREGPGRRSADVTWDGRNDEGEPAQAGDYLFRFRTPTGSVELGGCIRKLPPPPVRAGD